MWHTINKKHWTIQFNLPDYYLRKGDISIQCLTSIRILFSSNEESGYGFGFSVFGFGLSIVRWNKE